MAFVRRFHVLALVLALLVSLPAWVQAGGAMGASARAVPGQGKYPVGADGRPLAELAPGASARWVVNLPPLRSDGAAVTVVDHIDPRLRFEGASLRLPPGTTGEVRGGALHVTSRHPGGVEGNATVAATPFVGRRAQLTVSPEEFYADGRSVLQHVRGWGAARIDGAVDGVRLTVRDAKGVPVPGYTDRPATGGVLDLSGLGYPAYGGHDTSALTVTAKGAKGAKGAARLVVAFSGDAPQVAYTTKVTGSGEGVQGRVEARVGGERAEMRAAPVRVVKAAGSEASTSASPSVSPSPSASTIPSTTTTTRPKGDVPVGPDTGEEPSTGRQGEGSSSRPGVRAQKVGTYRADGDAMVGRLPSGTEVRISATDNDRSRGATGLDSATSTSPAGLGGSSSASFGWVPEGRSYTQRGTVTFAFSRPVRNPRLHLGGMGAPSRNMRLRLTGSTPSSPALGLRKLSGFDDWTVDDDGISNTKATAGAYCGRSGNSTTATSGCGSVQVDGTLTSLTFAVDTLRTDSTTSADAVRFMATADEDFGNASNLPAAGHTLSDLGLGAESTADSPDTVVTTPGTRGDDDADGVSSWPGAYVQPGTSYSVDVALTSPSESTLAGWIDWNGDGTLDTGERAVASPAAGATSARLTWKVPDDAKVGSGRAARIRLGYDDSATTRPGGWADSGEVEDYTLDVATPRVGLSLTKTPATGTYTAGEKVTYTVTVKNGGPAPALGAAIKDTLPEGLGGARWTCEASTGSACGDASADGDIDTTADIAAGGSVTYTVTGKVPEGQTGTIENTASVTRPANTSDDNCEPTCSATSTLTAAPKAGLEVAKVLVTSPVVPGEKVEWKVTVKNGGPSRARDVVVKDKVPAGVSGASMDGGSACTESGGESTCAPVEIPPGQSKTWTLTGTLSSGATQAPENNAVVTGGPDPSAPDGRTAVASPSTAQPKASLEVSKTLVTSPVVPGQKVEWRVTVKNGGPSRARDVVVKDKVPAGITGPAMSGASHCTHSTGQFSCAAVEIPAGESRTWTLTGTLPSDATEVPGNTATVTGGPDPSAPDGRTAVASPSTAQPKASLEVSKTLVTSPVVPGQKVEWRVTVKNGGPSRARDVVVKDKVPAGITGPAMSGASNCTETAREFTCAAVEVPAGKSKTWTLSGTLSADATKAPANTVTVTGGPDPSVSEHTASASESPAKGRAALEVTKVLVTSPVVPGEKVQWRVTVKNGGPSRARDVVVRDKVPAQVNGASMTGDSDCALTDGTYACAAVELAPGESKSWTLSGTLDAGATETPVNAVTVTGGPDPSASEHKVTASPTSSPERRASLQVTKVLVTSPVVPGEKVQWRVTVKNGGPSRARGVVVRDKVPAQVTGASMSGDSHCIKSAGEFTCASVEIPPGKSKSWTLSGTLSPDATKAPANTVTVTGGPDPSATDGHTAGASESAAGPRAHLEVAKVLVTSPVVPGKKIEWKVTVKNGGPSTARDVVVKDKAPAGVTGPAMTGASPCSASRGEFTCEAVSIPVGRTKTWTLTGTLDSGAKVTPANSVVVTGGPDPSATEGHTAVASPTASPVRKTSLTVSKTLVTSPVLPGHPIRWKVTVTNSGPSDAALVNVIDRVPDGVSAHSMTGDGTCGLSDGDRYLCTADRLPAGESATWTLTGTLPVNAREAPQNKVTMIEGPIPRRTDASTGTKATAAPVRAQRLDISKKADHSAVGASGTVKYTITVANTGGNDVRGATVTDDLSRVIDEADYNNDAKAPSGTVDYTAPKLTWTGDVARGKSLTITYTARVPAPLRTGADMDRTLKNTVTSDTPGATCPQAAPQPHCTATVAITDVTLRKSATPRAPRPGGKITYTVEVANDGTADHKGYTFTDDLKDVLDDADWNGDATASSGPAPVFDQAGRKLTWRGDVPAGQKVTVTYSVTVGNPPAGNAHLTNQVTSTDPGSNCPPGEATPNPECGTGGEGRSDGKLPRLYVQHHVDKEVARRGEAVAYTAKITNTGTAALDEPVFYIGLDDITSDAEQLTGLRTDIGRVRLTDKVETRARAAEALRSRPHGQLVRWDAESLVPGQTATVHYTVRVKQSGHQNLALTSHVWTPGQPSNCPTDNHARPECSVTTKISLLDFKKTVTAPKRPEPGDKVTYTISLHNGGSATFTGADFTDDLTQVLDDARYNGDASATSGTVSYAAPVLTWKGDIPAGGSATVTYSFTVKPEPGDRTLANKVTGTGPGTNCPAGSTNPDCHAVGIKVTVPPDHLPTPTHSPTGPVLPSTGTDGHHTLLTVTATLVTLLGLALVALARVRRKKGGGRHS